MPATKLSRSFLSCKHKKMLIFFFVGIFNTLVDFIVYTISSTFFQIPLTISTAISGSISSVSTFFTHGKITWKNRPLTKFSILRYATWSLIMVIFLRPFIAFIAEHLTPLYQFAFVVSSFLHLPFSYDFVFKTGVFIIIAAVIMVINFFVYEKFVFLNRQKTLRKSNNR